MKQRKTIAIIMTVILVLATVLTVFAAFRFEVQFPSKLNTFEYDDTSGSFEFDGVGQTFTLGLSDPGSKGEYKAVVQNGTATPLTYAYKISTTMSDGTAADATLLSSIFVYLNGEIMGTLQSLSEAGGLIGEGLYVLPNTTENDTLRLELHLASDATPYENASLTVTVNCTATNHNAQKLTFVDSADELIQAISEVNRGAADKTIVLYGGLDTGSYTSDDTNVQVTADQLTVTKPCTFDVQANVTFTNPITVNITSDPVDGVPTDIVTVRSTKSKGAATPGFAITAGAIDREDSAVSISIDGVANANPDSVQYILDNQIDAMLAHGIASGSSIDFSTKGFGCYVSSITSSDTTALTTAGKAITGVANLTTSKTVALTVTTTPATPEHTHSVKVIGTSDAVFEALFANELKYLVDLAGEDLSYSVPLPTVIKNRNATIEWKTSDPDKLTDTGMCAADANGYVTLTAIVRINEQVYTKDITYYTATLTNQDRLEAMIAAMGNLTLNAIAQKDENGNYTYNSALKDHVVLPKTENYVQTMGTTDLSKFDISKLWFEIDPALYDFIGFTAPHTCTETDGKLCHQTTLDEAALNGNVVLDYSTFETLAQVKVHATFDSGAPETVTSEFYINIELGDDSSLGDKILAYVQAQMNAVDVLQNMLDTRVDGVETGDFTMPVEYNGFTIQYTVSEADKAIASVDNATGKFTVVPSKFKTSAHDVTVTVKVLAKNSGATPSAIAEEDMYFTVPPVITNDQYGFAGDDLFFSIREQVMAVAEPAYADANKGKTDAASAYILQRDLGGADAKITTLEIDGDQLGAITSINGLVYFDKLTNLSIKNLSTNDTVPAQNVVRAAATFGNLTHLTLSNIGMTDMTPIEGLTKLTYLDLSQNAGLSNVSGLVKYDAKTLATLNISSTGVDMEYARPLLTEMYYEYAAANQNSEQKTPKYYYTHGYTPIADGALLLEPDAISVKFDQTNDFATVTVAGDHLQITNATINKSGSATTYTINAGGGTIRIDGEKQLAIPAGVVITVAKTSAAELNSPVVPEGILKFELHDTNTTESSAIQDLLSEGDIVIYNATLNGTVIETGDGSKLTANGMTHPLTKGEHLQILSGMITEKDIMSITGDKLTLLEVVTLEKDGEVSQLPAGVYTIKTNDQVTVNTAQGEASVIDVEIIGRGIRMDKDGAQFMVLLTSTEKVADYDVVINDSWEYDSATSNFAVLTGLVGFFDQNGEQLALEAGNYEIANNDIWSMHDNVLTVNGTVAANGNILINGTPVSNGEAIFSNDAFTFENTDSWELSAPDANGYYTFSTVGYVKINDFLLPGGANDYTITPDSRWALSTSALNFNAGMIAIVDAAGVDKAVMNSAVNYSFVAQDNWSRTTSVRLIVDSGYVRFQGEYADFILGEGEYELTNCSYNGNATITAGAYGNLAYTGGTIKIDGVEHTLSRTGSILVGTEQYTISSASRIPTVADVNANDENSYDQLTVNGYFALQDNNGNTLKDANGNTVYLGTKSSGSYESTPSATYTIEDRSSVRMSTDNFTMTVEGQIKITPPIVEEDGEYTSLQEGTYSVQGATVYLSEGGSILHVQGTTNVTAQVVQTDQNGNDSLSMQVVEFSPGTYAVNPRGSFDCTFNNGELHQITSEGPIRIGDHILPAGTYTVLGSSSIDWENETLTVNGYVDLVFVAGDLTAGQTASVTDTVHLTTGTYTFSPYSQLTLGENASGDGTFNILGDITLEDEGGNKLEYSNPSTDAALTFLYDKKNVIYLSAIDNLAYDVYQPIENMNPDEEEQSTVSGSDIIVTGGTLNGSVITISGYGTVTVDGNTFVVKACDIRIGNGQISNNGGVITIKATSIEDILITGMEFADNTLSVFGGASITLEGVNSFGPNVFKIHANGGYIVIGDTRLPLSGNTEITIPENAAFMIDSDDESKIILISRQAAITAIDNTIKYGNGTLSITPVADRTFTVSNASISQGEGDTALTSTSNGSKHGTITAGTDGSLLYYQGYYFFVPANTVIEVGGRYQNNWFSNDLFPGQLTITDNIAQFSFQNGSVDAYINVASGVANEFTMDFTTLYGELFGDAIITLPVEAFHPTEAGIQMAQQTINSTFIAKDHVIYSGKNFTEIGKGNAWSAVLIDGEHVTISDGATYTIADGKLTVTGGTSTIGKGALIYGTELDVDHTTCPEGTTHTMQVYVDGTLQNVRVTYQKDGSYAFALVDDILFEPFLLSADEQLGLDYLFLLGEIPTVIHTFRDNHGSFLQVADHVYYGINADNEVLYTSVYWTIVDGEQYVRSSEYRGRIRFETLALTDATDAEEAAGVATREVILRAQVNVNGKLTERYFAFTVTYYL